MTSRSGDEHKSLQANLRKATITENEGRQNKTSTSHEFKKHALKTSQTYQGSIKTPAVKKKEDHVFNTVKNPAILYGKRGVRFPTRLETIGEYKSALRLFWNKQISGTKAERFWRYLYVESEKEGATAESIRLAIEAARRKDKGQKDLEIDIRSPYLVDHSLRVKYPDTERHTFRVNPQAPMSKGVRALTSEPTLRPLTTKTKETFQSIAKSTKRRNISRSKSSIEAPNSGPILSGCHPTLPTRPSSPSPGSSCTQTLTIRHLSRRSKTPTATAATTATDHASPSQSTTITGVQKRKLSQGPERDTAPFMSSDLDYEESGEEEYN